MIERKGDAWRVIDEGAAHALCITSNGVVNKDGRCVMGRGIAAQAKIRFKDCDLTLGHRVRAWGNIVQVFNEHPALVAFPVKHHWREPADLKLIERSAYQLVELTDEKGWTRVVLPRPGCGNGQRDWSEVEPIIRPLLDDRFLVVWQ